jgi:hypothetical protein
MRKVFINVIFMVVLALGFVGAANANLITNGDFNNGFSNWETAGSVKLVNTTTYGTYAGMSGNFALLGGSTTDANSYLKQTFRIDPGMDKIHLTLNFAINYWDLSMSRNLNDHDSLFVLYRDVAPGQSVAIDTINFGDIIESTTLNPCGGRISGTFDHYFDIDGSLGGDLQFTLKEAKDYACLTYLSDTKVGIDNVCVTQIPGDQPNPAPVPEPATLTLLGIGLLGLGAFRKKG